MDTRIPIDGIELAAELDVPGNPRGVVIFVHGSGSDRRSVRDQRLAGAFRTHGLATLLFDLLTPDEARQDANDAELRLDAGFLADRLIGVTDWVHARPSIVPGAGHRFEEPGALDDLARVAGQWLVAHLLPPAPARRELGDAVC